MTQMESSEPGGIDDALDELFRADPDQFTSVRDALVRHLRPQDARAAAAVKALRRPPVSAWALNQVARSHPEALAALIEADDALARSQREGSGPQAITTAAIARREAIRRLLDEAVEALEASGRPASAANRDRIAQSLASLAADPDGREALLRGRLTRDLTPQSVWDTTPRPEQPGIAPAAPAGGPQQAPAEPEAGLRARIQQALAEAARAGAEADQAEAGAQRAEAEAERAERVALQARAAAVAAREQARAARQRAQQAQAAAQGPRPT